MDPIAFNIGILGRPWTRILPDKSHFPLIFAVAGVLAANGAVSGMAPVYVRANRELLWWYNPPGSYSAHIDAATSFGLGGSRGPRFRAVHSDTIIEQTGHLASLFMNKCAACRAVNDVQGGEAAVVSVTVAELNRAPLPQISVRRINAYSPVFTIIPIAVSVSTYAVRGLFADWYSLSSILSGVLASGISCLAIGSGELVFTHPHPLAEGPPGDGILGSGNEIALLRGAEGAVNPITRGRFSFRRPKNIGWCSTILSILFVAQLLFVSKDSLRGQAMLATSLAVSPIYNLWLSPLGEEVQRDTLLNDVLDQPVLTKYSFTTRRIAVVFILLVLQPQEPIVIINELLPNDTGDIDVWEQWRDVIASRLIGKEPLKFGAEDWTLDQFDQNQRFLLETLYHDAQAAYGLYVQHFE